jgi:hypothetical protein
MQGEWVRSGHSPSTPEAGLIRAKGSNYSVKYAIGGADALFSLNHHPKSIRRPESI